MIATKQVIPRLAPVLIFAFLGLGFGMKNNIGELLVNRIENSIDRLELIEAQSWDSEYKPYAEKWVKHPLVGKTKKEIIEIKGNEQIVFPNKHPRGLPESDEQWVYKGDGIYYFKKGVLIGADNGYRPCIFGGDNYDIALQKSLLRNMQKAVVHYLDLKHN